MKYKLRIIPILCIWFMPDVHAQSTDVRLLVEAAEEFSYVLKQAENRLNFEKTAVATAFEKPKLQFETQIGNIQNPFVLDYVVGAQQTFESPAVYRAKKSFLEAGIVTAEKQKQWEKKELVFRLSEIYFNLAHTHRMIQFLEKQDSLLLQVKKMAETRYEVGATDKLDVSHALVAIGKNRLRLAEVQGLFAQYEKQLKNILGDSFLPKLTFSMQDSLVSPLSYFAQGDSTEHPAKEWMRATMNQFEYKTMLEKKRLSPDFTLGFMNQSMQGSINQWVGVAGISIPIDQKPQKAKIQLAQLEKNKVALQLQELDVLQENEWRGLYKEWSSTYERIKTLEKEIIPSLADVQAKSLVKYQLGEQDFYWWNTYQQQYWEALQLHSDALKAYYTQKSYFMYLKEK